MKFFEERSEASEIKAKIVSSYFAAWANVIIPSAQKFGNNINYIDLYAGPGRYRDGAASTPLLVLETAIKDHKIAANLVSFFNDVEVGNTTTLSEEIRKLPGIQKLRHPPIITCGDVDEEAAKHYNKVKLEPTFSFIDPFGYRGLSRNIIRGVIKDWGCDCVFFFNYARINAGITNAKVKQHMDSLFSEARADKLRSILPGMEPALREAAILEELANEIKSLGGTFVLPFTFRNETGNRTTHKLIFVSKHFRGYNVMKSIMASASSTEDQGVASFAYSLADASMPLLFSLNQPMSKLKTELPRYFAGRSIKFKGLYEEHSVDRPYMEKHYRLILKELEADGQITVSTNKSNRRPGTYAEHVTIHFPQVT
ncbi:three-Cys-motif partner protein TcmP [Ruegeria profundi]|uniref:three-Cys-motif partner protein TcmP n=1 Tax=Ruegeria profundi TaxID=1685378 RepID=UPI001CD1A07B|nr:three-Cys-motif partner protein TcmP [Ruegeria profundi]MCA0930163.1 three-Cys-motif partner protein TcmP [Ruegeria profundi]